VKKLLIAVLVAAALPAFARDPREPRQSLTERNHVKVAVERANERQRESEAKVIQAKMNEHTKINEH
jgi:hypothetical protein